ncbi:MAG: fasciclin domain-containing protein, partial [Flavobacterium sp.]|nr:fasciclin domain-containing protein [Flavobacterium sp.]
ASLTEGQMVSTLQTPQKFTVQLAGGAKIKDVNNRISTIVATDVQCSNGVIHVLNKVLLPTL